MAFVKCGKAVGRVFEQKYCRSPIPRGGLEVTFSILDEGRRFLDRPREITQTNYSDPFPEAVDITNVLERP